MLIIAARLILLLTLKSDRCIICQTKRVQVLALEGKGSYSSSLLCRKALGVEPSASLLAHLELLVSKQVTTSARPNALCQSESFHLKQGRMIDPRHVKLKRLTLVTIIKVMPILHI